MKNLLLSIVALVACDSLLAQTPTAETVAAQFVAFQAERAAAQASPETLAIADKLAAFAEMSRKAESFLVASRLIRDARWSLPAAPKDLPAGSRVFGYQRLRSGDRVNSVHYNQNGTQIITASADRTVRVFDLANGHEVMVYRGHTVANTEEPARTGISNMPLRVTEAVFHPDGKRAASAGGKEIHLWDLATGNTLKTMTGPKSLVRSIAFNDDGSRLVSGGDDFLVRIFDVESGQEVFSGAPHSSRIEAVVYQPKGKFVAAVDIDGFLSVYDPTGMNKTPLMKVQVSEGGTLAVYAVKFTPDGTRILTGGADKIPRLTAAPANDGTVPPNVAGQKLVAHGDEVRGVDVTADGRYFISGGKDKTVRVADATGTLVRQFAGHSGEVTAVAVRPDGRQVVAAGDDGLVKVWDLDPVDDHKVMTDAKEPIWASAVSADGTRIATAGADKTVRVYNAAGKLEQTLTGSTAAVTSLVFLPDGKLLSAGGDKLIRVWDTATGKELAQWPGHAAAILALAAKPDGNLVVSGSADKSVTGWNPESGKVLWMWTARSVVAALAIHSDGLVAVGTADGGLTILRIESEKPAVIAFANAHVSGVACLTFSPDGKRLASTGGDGRPKLWTLDAKGLPIADTVFNPEAAKAIAGTAALSAIGFSLDGKLLATGGADRVIRIWDTADGKEIRMLRGATDWVTALAFIAENRLLTAGADAAGRIYELPRREMIADIGHTRIARAVALSPDGAQAISVGEDKIARVWNLKTGAETGTLRGATDRLLTVAFTKPNEIAVSGDDRRLRTFDVTTMKPTTISLIGKCYGLTANGTRLGVWSVVNEANHYEIFDTANPVKEDAAANPFRVGDVNQRLKPATSVIDKGRNIKAASFTADLSLVVTGDAAGGVTIWDMATQAKVDSDWKIFDNEKAPGVAAAALAGGLTPGLEATKKTAIADLGITADLALVIAVNTEGVIQIGDRNSRKSRATAKGPANGINGLIIAPKGNRFAVLGSERELNIYDFTGKELQATMLPAAAMSATFSADGRQLLTANADGSVYVLNVP